MLSQHLVIMKPDFISAEQEEAIIAQHVEKPNDIDNEGDSVRDAGNKTEIQVKFKVYTCRILIA